MLEQIHHAGDEAEQYACDPQHQKCRMQQGPTTISLLLDQFTRIGADEIRGKSEQDHDRKEKDSESQFLIAQCPRKVIQHAQPGKHQRPIVR